MYEKEKICLSREKEKFFLFFKKIKGILKFM